MALVFQLSAYATSSLVQTQEVDSLLEESRRQVYKTPNESIKLGLSIYQDENYAQEVRVKALLLVSFGYTSKRDYQKALEYIVKVDEISDKLDNELLEIEILYRTGVLYQQLKIYDKSIEFMEKTERFCLSYPDKDAVRLFLANSYVVKAFIYKDNLNCDIALDFFNKGILEYQKINSRKSNGNLSIIYYNIGNCYSMLGEYGNAKNSFARSISLAKRENADSLISFAEKGLAEVYTLEGNYKKAVNLLEEALERSKGVGDLVLNLGIYKGLFENHLALNEPEKFQEFYNLYLKTQAQIKTSERNSIGDSINESYKLQNTEVVNIKEQFNSLLKWSVLLVVIFVLGVLFLEIKNKKTIQNLTKKVDSLQGGSKIKK
ncbi:tetratricopeptide repeat protein [Pseudotamlana agarivorans]|uniref:tetratricopeptide repeat protein n=1 Tax=Pseudotamlana agarivorans TaxID=481183 RepID=UPI0008304FF8|nr:tetratricopeptide repeat protein [Tamlana agarivorans]